MKIRSGFVSNSSSSSFILKFNYDLLYDYDKESENANKIFNPSFPESLKQSLLDVIQEHAEKISETEIEVYIDPDYYIYSDINVILARNPYDFLNEEIIEEVRTHV